MCGAGAVGCWLLTVVIRYLLLVIWWSLWSVVCVCVCTCVYVYVYINIGGDVPRLIAVEGKISPDGRYDLLLFL